MPPVLHRRNNSNRTLVNFAAGGWYPLGQKRLIEQTQKFGENLITFDTLPPGAPSHKDVPYAFKPHAIQYAFNQGFDVVLWADASVAIQKPLPRVWEWIDRVGAFLPEDPGNLVGMWTTDRCLEIFGVDRDLAMKITCVYAGITGLTRTKETGKWLFSEWMRHTTTGAFLGPWKNDDQSCSKDPRCRGHRHDLSVLSLLSALADIPRAPYGEYVGYGKTLTDSIMAFYPPDGAA